MEPVLSLEVAHNLILDYAKDIGNIRYLGSSSDMLISRAVYSVSTCQFYFHLHFNNCHLNNQSSLLVIHLFTVFLKYKSKVRLARKTKFFTNLWQILSSHHSETIYGHIVIHTLLINFQHLFLYIPLQNITCKFHFHVVAHQGSGNFQKGLFNHPL